jgi:hypothetical protein
MVIGRWLRRAAGCSTAGRQVGPGYPAGVAHAPGCARRVGHTHLHWRLHKVLLGCSMTTWTCGCKEFHGENCNGRATELASPADVAMKVRVHRLR